jgi:hypothetical protein
MKTTAQQIVHELQRKLANDPNLIGSYDTEGEVNAARNAFVQGQAATPAPQPQIEIGQAHSLQNIPQAEIGQAHSLQNIPQAEIGMAYGVQPTQPAQPTPNTQVATGAPPQQSSPAWPGPTPQSVPTQPTQVAAAPMPAVKTSACHAASKRLKAKALDKPSKAKEIAEAVIRDKLR